MTYDRFEDLPVWKAAVELAHGVFDLVCDRPFNGLGDLRDQLQRASLSISNNIAEGFERGTTAELLTFLYIARGSAGEVRSALRFAAARPELAQLKPQISNLIPRCESISRQLRGWADSLQNSDIEGHRRLNDATRADYDRRRRSVEFLDKLREMQSRAPAAPPPAAQPESEV
jgi:four helix bundle protein